VTVEVHTEADGTGFLSRWLTISNTGDRPAALGSAWVWSGLLARVKDYAPLMGGEAPVFHVGYMTECMWGMEGAFDWVALPSTPLRIESRTGKSGHGVPFFVVRNEATGEHVVGALAWSGNWAVEFAQDYLNSPDAILTFRVGSSAPAPQRVIAPQEAITTPVAHLGCLQADFDGAIQAWHRHLRRSVLRAPLPGKENLVVYNHWGYMEHEMSEAALKAEVDVAVEVGAEIYIVDAGWFGDQGSSWWRTVGDWECGDRLPNGLDPVFDYARGKGLLCGMWFDLERLGPESEAAKDHTDWLTRRYGEVTSGGDMDLTNPEAVAHLERTLSAVIERWRLDLFRLDYNTTPFEGGQTLRDGYQENVFWRYYENVYALYDRIAARFPHLMMENCSGGGGRTDIGLVSRFSHTWVTDWQQAPRTLRILNGMTMALPPEYVDRNAGVGQSGHVRADLDFQVRSCMLGHFTLTGIHPRAAEANPDHVSRIRRHVELYKRFIRPFLSSCRVYHHTPVVKGKEPRGWAVLEYVSADGDRGVSGVFRLAGPSAEQSWRLRFRGVDAGRRYSVTTDNTGETFTRDGAALIHDGLVIRLARPLTSELILLQAET